MTQKLKQKAPLWLWAILFTVLIVVPILVVLHFTYHAVGFGIDLSFIGEWFLGYFMWGSISILNGIIAIMLPVGLGALVGYVYVTYVKGMKLSRDTSIQTTPTTLQGAPIQTQAFSTPTPTPIIQPIEKEKES